ncbi:protein tonB2-like [Phodopus roborovskii]|uniref:protein tonB2-like n=1 Tax=Phodopus roborovskii TaxID=109678 RepID=UPI0021E4817D|nr:protein tonB2-like [Phodopus roborovskii]
MSLERRNSVKTRVRKISQVRIRGNRQTATRKTGNISTLLRKRRHNPLAHRESSRFPTQKFALWTFGLKDKAGWKRAPFEVRGGGVASTRVPSEAASRPGQPSPPGDSLLRPPPWLLPQRPHPEPPPGLRLGRTHARPPTAAPLPAPSPRPQPPPRARPAPTCPGREGPATGRGARSALHFLVGLPATTATPLGKRACATACPAPGPMRGGACWGVRRLHDDRRVAQRLRATSLQDSLR